MARKPYKRFSKEFKIEAVRLAEESDKPVTQIARELGIRQNQIYKWKKQLKAPALTGSFNAIDPLMLYDAALEALVIREGESGVSKKLSRRISSVINTDKSKVQNFCNTHSD